MLSRFSLAPSTTGERFSLSGPLPRASPWTITWCFESTIAWLLYPWTVPCDVYILVESLSVMLLRSSLPLLPIFFSFSASHFSIFSACCCSLFICFSRLTSVWPFIVFSSLSFSISAWGCGGYLALGLPSSQHLRCVTVAKLLEAAFYEQDCFATRNWINHLHIGENVNRPQPQGCWVNRFIL